MKLKQHVFVICILFGVFSVSGASAAKPEKTLRVMTFNIKYNEPRDGENAWEFRKQKVADVIRFHKADIVGVQEALIGQLRDLEALLPGFAWCGVGRTDGKNEGEFSAILYRKGRFKLLETNTFWLSTDPLKAGSKSWDAAFPRIVTWAKFRDNISKKTFFQFNTHFDHVGAKAREESAKLILAKIESLAGTGSSFVLTGDFNVEENSVPYAILTGKTAEKYPLVLKDARYDSRNGHFGGNSTFSGFKDLIPNRKIDYVFVKRGTAVFEHGVLSDIWDGKWASDHLPVLAEISF
ncbi:MAG: endonuclease/exonuclease/phosphatase family protein [Pyrinomonadaceae bacterium]